MPDQPVLPLKKIREIERAVTWEDFAEDVNLFIDFMQNHLVVDSSRLANIAGVVVSDAEPSAIERDKLWINKESPYFIAIFANGEWQKFYKYVSSESSPDGIADLIWIKVTEPYGLGAYIDGSWEMFYKYPVDVPLRWDLANTKPTGLRAMSAPEIELFELEEPTNSLWEWVIFSPPSV
jgi:hypothetical protein